MTSQKPAHKTLPGGSIDYAYYSARAREIRSAALLHSIRSIIAWFRRLLQDRVRFAMGDPQSAPTPAE